MFEKELTSLKTFWEFLSDGLFNHARTCKSDECFRLRDDHIAKHCETRGNSACGRIGENGYIGQAGFVKTCQRRGDLCHLHQRKRALLHSSSARCRKDNNSCFFLKRSFNESSDL